MGDPARTRRRLSDSLPQSASSLSFSSFVYFVFFVVIYYFGQMSHRTSVDSNPEITPPTTSSGVCPIISFSFF